MAMQDYKRALYDFSAAIRAAQKRDQTDADKDRPEKLCEHYMNAGICNQMLGQYEEALAHYNYGIQKYSEKGDIFFHRGLANVSLERYQKGIDDFNNALKCTLSSDAMKYKVHLNLGINLRRVNNLDLSIAELRKAIDKQEKPQAYNNLGLSYFEQNEWEESISYYTKAIDLEQANTVDLGLPNEYLSLYLNNRGLANYHMKQFQDAIRDFNLAIEAISGTSAENFFNRGNVYLNLEEFSLAHSDYDQAIQIDKQCAKYYHAKGLAFQAEAEKMERQETRDHALEELLVQKAIECFGDALVCDEEFKASRFHQGLMFRRSGQFNNAIMQFTRVMQVLKTDKTVFIERGLVYQLMGNHSYAINDFHTAIEIDPACERAYMYSGISKFKLDQLQEAIADFMKAQELDEQLSGVHDGLGQCFHKLGSFEEALDSFQSAIRLEPNNIEYLRNRAACFHDQHKYDEAASDLNQALAQNPGDPQILYKLGLTYFADAKYKKAIKIFKEALRNKPFLTFESDIYYHIGLGYARVQKFEKSIWPFSRCIERIPTDIRYIHERAKSYQMIEYHKEAIEDFGVVIKRNPTNAHAFFRRAFSLKALKVSAV